MKSWIFEFYGYESVSGEVIAGSASSGSRRAEITRRAIPWIDVITEPAGSTFNCRTRYIQRIASEKLTITRQHLHRTRLWQAVQNTVKKTHFNLFRGSRIDNTVRKFW
jgi:hypothetical protein